MLKYQRTLLILLAGPISAADMNTEPTTGSTTPPPSLQRTALVTSTLAAPTVHPTVPLTSTAVSNIAINFSLANNFPDLNSNRPKNAPNGRSDSPYISSSNRSSASTSYNGNNNNNSGSGPSSRAGNMSNDTSDSKGNTLPPSVKTAITLVTTILTTTLQY